MSCSCFAPQRVAAAQGIRRPRGGRAVAATDPTLLAAPTDIDQPQRGPLARRCAGRVKAPRGWASRPNALSPPNKQNKPPAL